MRVTAAHIDVACVVPALRRVGEQIDGAHRSADGSGRTIGGRRGRNGDTRGQRGIVDELENLERAPRADGAGAWRRIVDEVGALQVNAARSEIADLKSGFTAETLLDRRAPLLDILRGGVWIKGGEAHGGGPENCGIEVERSLCFRGIQQ